MSDQDSDAQNGQPDAETQQSTVADEAPTAEEPGQEPVALEQQASAEHSGVADETHSEIEPEIEIPEELAVLPLKDTVVYPFSVIPLGIGKERCMRLIDEVMRG